MGAADVWTAHLETRPVITFEYLVLKRDGSGQWQVEPQKQRIGEPGASLAEVMNLIGAAGFELAAIQEGGAYIFKRPTG